MTFGVTFKASKLTIAADKVQKSVDRGIRKALLAQAFDIRKAAVKSIKRAPITRRSNKRKGISQRRGSSRPNSQPFYHVNRFFPSHIFFAYDSSTKTAVIGPAKVTNTKIPAALEKGGTTNAVRFGKRVRQKIRPRPYMNPAHIKLLPGYVLKFRGVITP